MAIGDAAAAAGLEVVPSTQDLKQGYARINQKGDELAAEMTARAAADTALGTSKFDAAKIIYSATTPTYVAGAIWLKPV
ncbi:MAG: hypothetical protein JWP85_996 [Rhodoglobus sp.]|nr:hypothetical protein [Rhodoglobus sp.]